MVERIKLAIQKSGRLFDNSISILKSAGIHFEITKGKLICECEDFPLDLLLVRDDDIPGYVESNACDIGVVGFNELEEKVLAVKDKPDTTILKRLGFGKCRLSLATPNDFIYEGLGSLEGKRVATSYPQALAKFFKNEKVNAEVVEVAGSVEIAPGMGYADIICDLVSTGSTLRSNSLKEVETIFESEAVLVGNGNISEDKKKIVQRLLTRIEGVLKASRSKYIMMNAPLASLADIKSVIPSMEEPTVLPLADSKDKVAVHVVAPEYIFWETMEKLKQLGATSILVVPIEKILA